MSDAILPDIRVITLAATDEGIELDYSDGMNDYEVLGVMCVMVKRLRDSLLGYDEDDDDE